MLSERLQVLITKAQRRRLESEARRRHTSVGALIREAIDGQLHRTTPTERRDAFEAIRAMRGRFFSVDDLERIVDAERDRAARTKTR